MSTFLQICQAVGRDCGTISGAVPSTVVSQTGDRQKVVERVQQAHRDIQNLHANWRWLRAEFTAPTVSGTARYTSTSAGWALTRWAEWLRDTSNFRPYSIYLTSTGVSDEATLKELAWEDWRARYGRGTQNSSKPAYYAISPAGEFCLGDKPDAVYTVNGEYRKGLQTLAVDADEPEMPSRFHRLIEWRALALLQQEEEGFAQAQTYANEFAILLRDLERDQLPLMGIGDVGALA